MINLLALIASTGITRIAYSTISTTTMKLSASATIAEMNSLWWLNSIPLILRENAMKKQSKLTISLLACELFRKYGVQYDFCFNRRKDALGVCNYRKKKIYFSLRYLYLPLEEVRDTILHEIAHYIANKTVAGYRGHGSVWKIVCMGIGARPEETYKGIYIEPKPYTQHVFSFVLDCVSLAGFAAKNSWEKAEKALRKTKKKLTDIIRNDKTPKQSQLCFDF